LLHLNAPLSIVRTPAVPPARAPNPANNARRSTVKHGLTAQTAVLPSEDLAAFNRHVQQFLNEHRPATETQIVHELANIAWRQNRVPLLDASLSTKPPVPNS
jgi:hypothetical protein